MDGERRKYLMGVSDDKMEYILEEVDSKEGKVLRKKVFVYTTYFTEEGEFLETTFKQNLNGFMRNAPAKK